MNWKQSSSPGTSITPSASILLVQVGQIYGLMPVRVSLCMWLPRFHNPVTSCTCASTPSHVATAPNQARHLDNLTGAREHLRELGTFLHSISPISCFLDNHDPSQAKWSHVASSCRAIMQITHVLGVPECLFEFQHPSGIPRVAPRQKLRVLMVSPRNGFVSARGHRLTALETLPRCTRRLAASCTTARSKESFPMFSMMCQAIIVLDIGNLGEMTLDSSGTRFRYRHAGRLHCTGSLCRKV